MELCEIEAIVKKEYNLNVNYLEKIKNVYKIITVNKKYCLKLIKYEFEHFFFIINAIKHLKKNEFKNVLEIIKTKDEEDYIKIGVYYAYLTEWVEARHCNYDNTMEVTLATCTLAKLHKKSLDFKVSRAMKPRIGWLKWIDGFNTKKNQIVNFKKHIYKTEFDYRYKAMLEDEVKRASRAVDNLISSEYILKMKKDILKRGFCHHDFANHNVLLMDEGNIIIIDFDYCILDTHLHDVASLLLRKMKNGKWDLKDAEFILDIYSTINLIEERDIPIMAAFMEFPQDYWQLGIQYYVEKQKWGEEFFLHKLKKIYQDTDAKQEFIERFKILKYGGNSYE